MPSVLARIAKCRLPALTVLLAGSPGIVLCSVRGVVVQLPRPAVPRSLPLPLPRCALVVVSSSLILVTRSAVVWLQSRGWLRLLVIRVGRIDEARIKVARLLRATRTGRRPPVHLVTAATLLFRATSPTRCRRRSEGASWPTFLISALHSVAANSRANALAGMSSIRQRTTRRSAAAAAAVESPADGHDSDPSPARRRSDNSKSASGSTRDSPTKQRLPLTERRKGKKGDPAADLTCVAPFRRRHRPS